jgi:hypothetical protein
VVHDEVLLKKPGSSRAEVAVDEAALQVAALLKATRLGGRPVPSGAPLQRGCDAGVAWFEGGHAEFHDGSPGAMQRLHLLHGGVLDKKMARCWISPGLPSRR